VVRIVERGVTRVSEQNVSIVLKSAELILLMSVIVNTLNGKQSSKWRSMSPVSMENIALLNKSVQLGEFVHYKGFRV
jgi:hypothetical protein